MTPANIVNPGSLKLKLDNYFNTSAFCAPPTFVDPNNPNSVGYGFGSLGRGLEYGHGQYNTDLSPMRQFHLPGPESAPLEFRTEIHAFDTPQFAALTTTQGASRLQALASRTSGASRRLRWEFGPIHGADGKSLRMPSRHACRPETILSASSNRAPRTLCESCSQ